MIMPEVEARPAHNTYSIYSDMFVQHLDRKQLYQQPTGVLMMVLCRQDGDTRLV